ncbi:MAG TPA: translation elongation factor Ts [Spirochaetia bacterium]|nr:translation elongation factor Ts [Spirochaetia bacterium]
MQISAQSVRELRTRTGAGMMECKLVLNESDGDLYRAEALLKERGRLAVEKRHGRETNDGRLFLRCRGTRAVLIELRCETDYVAMNSEFAKLGEACVEIAYNAGDALRIEAFEPLVAESVARIKENIVIGRIRTLDSRKNEYLSGYVHGTEAKIGSLVRISTTGEYSPSVEGVMHELALHVVAAAPQFVSGDLIPAVTQAQVTATFVDEAERFGKSQSLLAKIVEGRWNRYREKRCLLEQGYFRDESRPVRAWLADIAAAQGMPIAVTGIGYINVRDRPSDADPT